MSDMFTKDLRRRVSNLAVFCLFISGTVSQTCTKVSSCACTTDSGFKIDLTPLGNTDTTPRFQDIPDSKGKTDVYSWNPCQEFTEGTCVNEAACKVTPSGMITQYLGIGTQDSATFLYDDKGRLTIQYTTGNATTAVNIICSEDDTGSVTAYGLDQEGGQKEYHFELKTAYACPPKHPTAVSIGTYLCIGCGVFLIVYIVGGVLFQSFVRKETGKLRIPNLNFWTAMPALIRDGVMFVLTRGKKKVAYDRI
ncbi:uncharacterized protein LOC110450385 [Mizuhopecten yessoensis]|uniref:Autophagy-related protein 27 n=1 Tax=Mizuhopecten yessoensis TaxID=6573 RepID=A0A210QP02_MIZYE|nr:uncharacterized protein LOC110450385 [Mizuhopecten yessoensis]OWF50466.1 Cation-dependent mannose-6-phosphate receptor [Mizuhopecten yessoensis]